MLLTLFAHIGDMPELDFGGMTATLAAVAVVGLLFSVFFAGAVLATGLMLRTGGETTDYLRSNATLLALILPGLFTVVGLAIAGAFFPSWKPLGWLMLIPFLFLIVCAGLRLWFLDKNEAFDIPTGFARWKWRGGKAVGLISAGYLWINVAILAFLMLMALFPASSEQPKFPIRLVMWTTVCYAINVAVVRIPKASASRMIPALGTVGLVALIVLSGNLSGIPAAAVRALGLGETPVGLVLTPEGCDILNRAARGHRVCNVAPSEHLAFACPIFLHSRIGSTFFVEVSSFDGEGRWPAADLKLLLTPIPIPRSEVRSWPTIEPLAASSPANSQEAGRLVSYLDRQDLSTIQIDWLNHQCGLPSALRLPSDRSDVGVSASGAVPASGTASSVPRLSIRS